MDSPLQSWIYRSRANASSSGSKTDPNRDTTTAMLPSWGEGLGLKGSVMFFAKCNLDFISFDLTNLSHKALFYAFLFFSRTCSSWRAAFGSWHVTVSPRMLLLWNFLYFFGRSLPGFCLSGLVKSELFRDCSAVSLGLMSLYASLSQILRSLF